MLSLLLLKNNSVTTGLNLLLSSISTILTSNTINNFLFLVVLWSPIAYDVYFEYTERYKKDDYQRTQRFYIRKLLQTKSHAIYLRKQLLFSEISEEERFAIACKYITRRNA